MRQALLIIPLLLYGCGKPRKANTFDFEAGVNLAELRSDQIEEASGLVESISNKGMFWTHNDSGNPAEVFLVDKKLTVVMVCRLEGIENRDWEDITVGPGPVAGKSYLYIGEIGDNLGQYQYKSIYRIEEPDAAKKAGVVTIKDPERIIFQLPDKRKDTEALMIHPRKKDLYIVSKRENPVVVYRLKYPQSTSDTLTAETVCSIPITQVVSGDFSVDGSEILLKNYQNVFFWNAQGDEPIERTFSRPGKILTYVEEPQGEAITFARDGSGYYTISEKAKGEKVFLKFYRRK
jgi:hypothetical protein